MVRAPYAFNPSIKFVLELNTKLVSVPLAVIALPFNNKIWLAKSLLPSVTLIPAILAVIEIVNLNSASKSPGLYTLKLPVSYVS